MSQHLFVRRADSASQADVEALFDAGFRYAKQVNRIPLLRGMQFGYTVIPCLVVNHADEGLRRYAETRPRKHFSLFEFPVIVDLGSGTTHFYRQTAAWGAFFFSDIRAVVENGLVNAMTAV